LWVAWGVYFKNGIFWIRPITKSRYPSSQSTHFVLFIFKQMKVTNHSKKSSFSSHILGDVFGGITSAVASLPLALAFGVGTGLGAQAGLYGAIGVGLFSAIFGGTKGLISAPTAPMTAVSTVIISQLVAQLGGINEAMGSIMLTFIVAGISQIIFGLLRIGQFVHFIPYPVVSGFMTGVGALIILSQVGAALGIPKVVGKVDLIALMWQKSNVLTLDQIIAHTNLTAVAITGATLLVIILFKKITTKIPASLVALILMTIVVQLLGLEVPTIGNIPHELPMPSMPDINFSVLSIVLVGGAQLGGLGVLDTLLTSVIADNITKTKHNPNKELIGQGMGQIVSGLFGGIPGAGTTTCTVINIKAGGYTWLAGVTNAVFLLLVLLLLHDWASVVPFAVLAGILLKVGTDIIDYQGFRYVKVAPTSDTVIIFLVLLITVIDDLLDAVAVGMVVALVMFMKKMSDVMKTKSYSLPLEEYLHRAKQDKYLEFFKAQKPDLLNRIVVKNIDGPLFFGHVPLFQERLSLLKDIDILVIDMSRVPYMDEAGIHAFKESARELKNKGIQVVLAEVQELPMQMLRASGVCATFPAQDAVIDLEQHIYKDVHTFLDTLLKKETASV
jgi:SulP family sulfate permease